MFLFFKLQVERIFTGKRTEIGGTQTEPFQESLKPEK